MSENVKKGPRTWAEFLGKPPETMKLVLVATAAGVVFMSVPTLFGLKSSTAKPPAGATAVVAQPKEGKVTDIEALQERMNRELESFLADIAGAGKVRVSVRLATGVISVPVINTNRQETTTGEQAADKSHRDQKTTTVTETNVVIQDTLAVSKQLRPQIAGVSIIADGAVSAAKQYELRRAVARQLGIPFHLIDVRPAERGHS